MSNRYQILIFLLILLTALQTKFIYCQTAQPSPTVLNTEKSESNEEVVKISSSLIQLDVVVRDKNGNVVRDLKPEDFEILENGNRRQISGISFINKNLGAESFSGNGFALSSSNSAQIINKTPALAEAGGILAIVVDDARMSLASINFAKKSLTEFVQRNMQPGDLIGIIKTSGNAGIIPKFTNNKEQLLKEIGAIQFNALTSVGTSAFQPLGINFSQQVTENLDDVGSLGGVIADRPDIESLNETIRSRAAVVGALRNLDVTVQQMKELRGRKALMLISEGINLRDTEIGFAGSTKSAAGAETSPAAPSSKTLTLGGKNFQIDNILRYVTEIANRNSVSIYTLDPRGAVTTNLSAADATHEGMFSSMSSSQIDQTVVKRNENIRNSQETLRTLAEETGGKSYINGNDLPQALREAIDSQNGYYLVAYQPDEETFDSKSSRFNKISIKVKRSNVNVSYRNGFFNVISDDGTAGEKDDHAVTLQKLFAPFGFSGISVQAASVVAYGAQRNSVVRSFVNILPSAITLIADAQGRKSADFDLIIGVANEDNVPLGVSAKNFKLSLNEAQQKEFLKIGIVSNFNFNASAAGMYKIKILIRDKHSGKIGTASHAVLVPDFVHSRLALSGLLLQNLTTAQ